MLIFFFPHLDKKKKRKEKKWDKKKQLKNNAILLCSHSEHKNIKIQMYFYIFYGLLDKKISMDKQKKKVDGLYNMFKIDFLSNMLIAFF